MGTVNISERLAVIALRHVVDLIRRSGDAAALEGLRLDLAEVEPSDAEATMLLTSIFTVIEAAQRADDRRAARAMAEVVLG